MKNNKNSNIISSWLIKKGWSLYRHQKEILKNVNIEDNILLTSPTGTGKTLSGFLPSLLDLSQLKKSNKILHTLYISPLKSLTYDIERNIVETLNEIDINIKIDTRTGDTSHLRKKNQLLNPPNILMTTIESFAILMSEKSSYEFFRNIKFVIIDEIHTFLNKKRGELLSLNLARLNNISKSHKKIMLSATIKDCEDACRYFCNKKAFLINAKVKKQISVKILSDIHKIPWTGYTPQYAIKLIYEKLEGNTCIIFVNTRAQAELLFQNLWKINEKKLKIALHHGSLEKRIRLQVENKMANGELDCVIATSSLDLGIDWSSVNLIIQIGAPKGVTRLVQRIGRSNHFLDGQSTAYLVPTNKFEFLECTVAIQAIKENDLEEIIHRKGSIDVLAQHITGVACSTEFCSDSLYSNILKSWPFRNISKKTFNEVLNFLSTGGYSLSNYDQFRKLEKKSNGRYEIKKKKFIKQYKMNVGTIVESEMLEVKLNNKKLGQIEEWFIKRLEKGDTFLFGGEILALESIKMNIVKVSRTKAHRPKIPSYAGGKMPLSTKLAFRVIELINNKDKWKKLPSTIITWLESQKNNSILPPQNGMLIESFPRNIDSMNEVYYLFYTFEGSNVNQTLGFVISKKLEFQGIKALGFVCTDYALAMWVNKKIKNVNELFEFNNFKKSLINWLEESSLFRRNFKKVSVISGLLDRGFPNKKKNHLSINSDLIFKVLKKYERNHILIRATEEESKRDLIEIDRLEKYVQRINKNILIKNLKKPSPLSIPLILQINTEVLNKDIVDEYYLNEIEKKLLLEAGLK